MQYGVPGGLGISDIEDDVKPWQLVYPVIDWQPVEEVETDEDGNHVHDTEEEHNHAQASQLWFPAVLHPCIHAAGHAPAMTWFGPMHITETRKEALAYARMTIKRIRRERAELDLALTAITSDAAAKTLDGGE